MTPATDATAARIAALSLAGSRAPHGTRARYIAAKCKCDPCRKANSEYRKRRDREQRGQPADSLISADPARRHIEAMSARGIGSRAIAAASGVARTIVTAVRSGERPQIRRSTAERILRVDGAAIADCSHVPAGPTWEILDALIAEGYTRGQLARWLGQKRAALQFRRARVTALTASKVARMAILIEAGRLRRP